MGLPIPMTTVTVTSITLNSATSGGHFTAGIPTLTGKGIVWKKNSAPTSLIDCEGSTNEGTSQSDYISYMTGLTPSSHYYVNAWAFSGQLTIASGTDFYTLAGPPPTPMSINILGQSVILDGQKITLT